MAIKKITPYKFTVSCIIPIWKEHIIYKVLAKFDKPYVDEIVLVVDEPTEEIKMAIEIGKNKAVPPTTLIINKKRMGIGYAIREGLKFSLQKLYDVVVIMAGNGKDNPQEIPKLLKKIEEGYDYVQGSRFLPGGKYEKTPVMRGLFIRLWPYIWYMFTKVKCTDVTNGFRAYKLSILNDKRINIDQEWLNGYQLEYYLHYKVLTLGYKIKEVPVSKIYPFKHRGGYSKIFPLLDWWQIISPLVYLFIGVKK